MIIDDFFKLPEDLSLIELKRAIDYLQGIEITQLQRLGMVETKYDFDVEHWRKFISWVDDRISVLQILKVDKKKVDKRTEGQCQIWGCKNKGSMSYGHGESGRTLYWICEECNEQLERIQT